MNGYDGAEIKIGYRVEMHPATDLWMQGDRYGDVIGFNSAKGKPTKARVRLDRSKRTVLLDAHMLHVID